MLGTRAKIQKLRTALWIGAGAVCALRLAGCATSAQGEATPLRRPQAMVFSFVPSARNSKVVETAAPMMAFLSKELGLPVRAFAASSYRDAAEQLDEGSADVSILPPLATVYAADFYHAKIMLRASRNGKPTYRSIFLARKDSGIKSLAGAKGKRVAFVNSESASGYLYPIAFLHAQKLDENTFFSKQIFAGSHPKAVIALYNGNADVGAVFDDARSIVAKDSSYADVDSKVIKIGQTDEIPNESVCVSSSLDTEFQNKIQKACLNFAKTSEGKTVLTQLYDADGLMAATSADYDGVRNTARNLHVSLDLLFHPTESSVPVPVPARK